MKDFRGTGVALVTPFLSNGEVDYKSLEKLVAHVIDGGIDYLVVEGSTGEAATLNQEEKQRVLDCVLSVNASKLPVVFGHTGNDTRALIRELDKLDLGGVNALLSASPFYNKPSQAGIIAHYKALADASPKPVIMYNVPGRTASNMAAASSLELAAHPNIIAIKEASGNLDQIGVIVKNRPAKFLVLSGDDPLIVPHMALGGDGIISVVANVFPREFSEITRFCFQGDYNKARQRHYLLINFINLLFAEGNPAGVKAALHIMGIIENNLRLPLLPVSATLMAQLEKSIVEIRSYAHV